MEIKKLVRIPVETPQGERRLTFKKYDITDSQGKMMCTACCPYKDICERIPDPRNPEDKSLSFIDYCSSLNESDDEEYLNCVPVEGTIEKELRDIIPDIYQQIIKEENLVPVNKVIDSVCSGWCDLYSKDHTNCTSNNKLCILNSLFPGKEDKSEKENKNE